VIVSEYVCEYVRVCVRLSMCVCVCVYLCVCVCVYYYATWTRQCAHTGVFVCLSECNAYP
jgi:hypothetical protein